MSRLRLAADDLTGALDSAVAFCGVGPVPVLLDQRPGLDDAALDLACRDGTEDAAIAAVREATVFLAGADIAYLKIDSLLRGHWAAMLATLWQTRTFRDCVLAPAFPSLGRITRRHRQFWRDLDGALHAVEVNPVAALEAHGVSVAPCPRGVQLCDAETHDDLCRIVAASRDRQGPILWCGSAGLATALAATLPHAAMAPQAIRLAGPVLVIAGSVHAVSDAQVAHTHRASGRPPLTVRLDVSEVARIATCLRDAGFCVVKAQIEPGASTAQAAAQITAVLHRLLPALPPPGTLVVVGGETLRAACRALECARLDVAAQVASGIPVSRMEDGIWAGTPVVSKSGAFGAVDALTQLLLPHFADACRG